MKYAEIEYNGDYYLYLNGEFVEKGTYIIPPDKILKELCKNFYSKIDYTRYKNKELRNFIRELKNNNSHELCLKVCLFYFDKNIANIYEIKYILPIITSLYRSMSMPEEVIKLNEKVYDIFGKKVFSVALLTSIAAAYCDMREYDKAKSFCDSAYYLQGGGIGSQNELSLVYARIEKERFFKK